MVSLGSFFHRQSKGVPPVDADADSYSPSRAVPKSTKLMTPSTHWTPHQFFYVVIMQGIGAFIIAGGINFAIAYALYAHVDVRKSPIRLFRLPNTFSGDAAVTIFASCVISWFISLITVNADLRGGKVQPIGFVNEPKQKLLRWYLYLDAEQPVRRKGFHQWIVFILAQIARALLFGVPLFFLTWPATVGILTSSTLGSHRDGDYYYARTWTPQIFKLIFGGILGTIISPCFALMWLLTVGWRERRALPITESSSTASMTPIPKQTRMSQVPETGSPATVRGSDGMQVPSAQVTGAVVPGSGTLREPDLAAPLEHDRTTFPDRGTRESDATQGGLGSDKVQPS